VRGGLLLRTAIASGTLAVIVGGAFAVLLVAVEDLRSSARMEALSETELDAADRLERLVVDIETGLRGFVITRQEQFLQPFNAGRVTFRDQLAALQSNEVNSTQARRLQAIAGDVGAYVNAYAVPLIGDVRRGMASAHSVAATDAGKRRVDAIRAQFDAYRTLQLALRSTRKTRDDTLTRRAVIASAVGLGGSIILVILFGGYLARALVFPVRRVAGMAALLAGGNLAVRVPEVGAGETGELERAFNSMAGSLEANRDELRLLVDEQSALRRVATLAARGVSAGEVLEAVAAETLALMGADAARVCRYETDGTATVVADASTLGTQIAVGTRVTLDGESVTASVLRTGRPSRRDSLDGSSGTIAGLARERGLSSAVGAPIVVEGRLWGVIIAHWRQREPLPDDAERRIAEFAELLATAIANADSRDELVASRARVLAAGDDARRRVVRDLHDGAQQRLVHTIITLKLARRALQNHDHEKIDPLVSEALEQAEQANVEVRELARGILPSVLTRGGIQAAVEALMSRLDVPVTLEVSVDRLPAGIEASAYFVVAEALTNVVKHSQATRVDVTIWRQADGLHVEIKDDGVGGAHADGTGLIGLDDRVAALGGQLRVDSARGRGTVITATLPLPV
jgi:signal transduction histidine kinase